MKLLLALNGIILSLAHTCIASELLILENHLSAFKSTQHTQDRIPLGPDYRPTLKNKNRLQRATFKTQPWQEKIKCIVFLTQEASTASPSYQDQVTQWNQQLQAIMQKKPVSSDLDNLMYIMCTTYAAWYDDHWDIFHKFGDKEHLQKQLSPERLDELQRTDPQLYAALMPLLKQCTINGVPHRWCLKNNLKSLWPLKQLSDVIAEAKRIWGKKNWSYRSPRTILAYQAQRARDELPATVPWEESFGVQRGDRRLCERRDFTMHEGYLKLDYLTP